MKRRIFFLFVLFILLTSIIFVTFEKKEYFKVIDYEHISEVIDSGEKAIIVIGRENCKYCIELIDKIKVDIEKEKEMNLYGIC